MARASAALVQSRGDRVGMTVDFRLSTGRDVAAAKAFFRKAIDSPRRAPWTALSQQPGLGGSDGGRHD